MEGRDEAFGHEIEYFAGWNHDASFRVRAESEGFWRRLCPDLSITDRPFDRAGAPYTFPPDVVARAAACMRREGYLATGPVVEPQLCELMARAALRVVEAGFHPLFLSVYDEFWQPLRRLGNLLQPIFGAPPRLLGDFWVWCVGPRHAPAGWAQHRDRGGSETVAPDGTPSLLTVWVPFTDATRDNGCIRVLPASRDPELGRRSPGDASPPEELVAIPARAGAVLAWNQEILHGGGPCLPTAAEPRISVGVYLQSAARESYGTAIPFDAGFPFAARLRFIAAALLRYQSAFRFPPAVLQFVGDQMLPAPATVVGWQRDKAGT